MKPSSADILKQTIEGMAFFGYRRETTVEGDTIVDRIYRPDGTLALTARVTRHPEREAMTEDEPLAHIEVPGRPLDALLQETPACAIDTTDVTAFRKDQDEDASRDVEEMDQ